MNRGSGPVGFTPAIRARHAASLLVWRTGPDGPAVLMGVRGAGHRFVPGRLVFPGGAVDRADHKAAAATEPRADTLAALQHRTRPALARAIAAAAARELTEETGLTLGRPPDLAALEYLCRAVTPTTSKIRFNARFLAVPACRTLGLAADSHELQAVRFYPVDEALEMNLMAVTSWVLSCLVERLAQPGSPQRMLVFRRERPTPDGEQDFPV